MGDLKLRERIKEEEHYEYLQLPERLAKRLNFENKSDYKGVEARYEYIKSFFQDNSFEKIINIGGNCGYYSLSLLDDNLAEEAIIYDIKSDILDLGESIAESMGLADRCEFKEKMINLEELETLPDSDILICQNVIHHAGDYFDKNMVKDLGWDNYIEMFLEKLRQKYSYSVLAVGFKWNKPKYWNIEKNKRRQQFAEILHTSGWNIISDVNVYNLMLSDDRHFSRFSSENNRKFDKSELGYLWDLITFNAIKHASILLGSKTEKIKTSVPALAEMAREIAKSYHIYLLK